MSNDIIICGDSWMSPRVHIPSTHFSEIFAKQHNLNLVAYARAAMGNGGIFLQIEEAIRKKPKLILVGITYSDRIEFNSSNDFREGQIKTGEVILKDLVYGKIISDSSSEFGRRSDLSCVNLSNINGSLKSEALLQFVSDDFYSAGALEPLPVSDQHDKLQAIKMYFRHLHHVSWKAKVDTNLMYAILHKLHLSDIPYIICFNALESTLNKENLYWLQDKNIFWPKFIRLPLSPGEPDPGYHTSFETQIKIANILIEHYQKYFESDTNN